MPAHAILSASGSKRWLACPPSALLETKFPDTSSEAAREGTFAHYVAEKILSNYLSKEPLIENQLLSPLRGREFYSEDLIGYVREYTDACIEKINAAKAADTMAVAFIEEKLDFSKWVPKGFGTGDCVIISDGILEIIDLKYGKGVPVSAEGNTQMQLYALGAIDTYNMLYDFDLVRMTIVQPRNGGVSQQEKSVKELLEWACDVVQPTAAWAIKGEGELCAGDHCQFCRAALKCKTYSDYCMEIAKLEFSGAELLDDEDIVLVLERVDHLVSYAKKIKEFALGEALNGKKWTGFKIVEGKSRRVYSDDSKVADTLTTAGYKTDQIFKPKELLGLTEMQKLLTKKKFDTLLSDLITKPAGKPALVPATDKRPEYNPVEADFKNLME
ncbi:DUF2800 domain-containing protein [Pectinatus frisingensis]|uniref:DUF2800 domain-containing protein n=1 Tax=Pectinatus frisingensis TaxID=865 RepID=UPI0018C802C9|nr:DUF2800 domain-containing protein [Pectinatus frisingensis]